MRRDKKVFWFKILLAAFALVLLLSPVTVARVPEIEQRVVVSVLGLDAAKEGYKASAQVIIPMRASEGDPKQEVYDAEGSSVSEAIDKLNRAMGRKAELGHCGVIVIGKELGERGVKEELGYMFAGGIVTPGTNLVSVKTDANAFLKGAVSLAASSVTGLDSFITFASSGSHTATLTLNRFLSSIESESKTSYMPVLELNGQEEDAGQGKEEEGGDAEGADKEEKKKESSGGQKEGGGEKSGGEAKAGGEKAIIKSAETVALFYDGKYAATFDADLTRGIVWADKKSDRGQIQLDAFSFDGKDYGGIYAKLLRKKRVFKTRFEDGTPIFTVKLRVKLELEDKHKLNELSEKAGTAEATALMERAFADKARTEMQAAIDAGLKAGIDPFEIRSCFYKTSFDGYAEYGKEEFLNDVRVDYDIKVKVV